MKKVLFAQVAFLAAAFAQAPSDKMNFFLTSEGSGKGADLGGLKGADAHCAQLAKAAGSKKKDWKAYLSTDGTGGTKVVNAKDRIGKGPWFNAKGEQVAVDVADLHSANNKLGKQGSISEKGAVLNGRGDTPNQHDILTGSTLEGLAFTDGKDHTCKNWTSSGSDGSAQVGHHDRQGGGDNPTSWNAAHASKGCSQENLVATGGSGRFYCFATK
ncbi:hypothetical protein [Bryobacter aggregatus]|uniref:hypothetical protein n=1 Tax=Bryobacter aggregatus TaxID=360054 RepID=UPI0004E0B205